MSPDSIWITGSSCSGKTTRLIEHLSTWTKLHSVQFPSRHQATVLIFAANGDNRIELAERLSDETQGRQRFDSTTPLGFFQNEIILFYPLLAQQLGLKAPFPLRLRPETEQELATRLWRSELDSGRLHQEGVQEYYLVRRALDLMQLAAMGGTPLEEISTLLEDGIPNQEGLPDLWNCIGEVLLRWREWCLERGLLTYGIITELYWRYLLPNAEYQRHLSDRYQAVLADDVDEYPAIAHSLFTFLLDQGIPGTFTYNPNGSVRLGLGADPNYLATLANRCQIEHLTSRPESSLGVTWGEAMVQWVSEPMLSPLPESIQVIQTTSRAQLLRQTAEAIASAIHSGQVQAQDVAVIGPGLDAIARYTLREILTNKGIAVEALNDQHPLSSSPTIRALLTLLALVYPGLGRSLDREAVAEMLVVLSQSLPIGVDPGGLELTRIDPVRAGLLTDYCFAPDPEHPQLLSVTHFPRWDRLGYQATQAYGEILQWIETQQLQQQQRLIPNPVALLDRAIQRFLFGGSHLAFDRLAALRELMETAQHYWEVDSRLRQSDSVRGGDPQSRPESTPSATVAHFIQLLRGGTITADPYPVRPMGKSNQAVTLATIFQYRANRRFHRWQFWLDVGSALWLTGGGSLFGAPLMLQDWSGRLWTAADAVQADQQRLQRQILDLLCRAGERVYFCHSELATSGQEQTGPLLTLVNAAVFVPPETLYEGLPV